MDYDYYQDRDRDPVAEHHLRVMHQIQLRRYLRDHTNPLDISVTEFIKLYRMPQHKFLMLVDVVRPYIPVGNRADHVPVEIKVLCALHFYAVGSYQRSVGRSADINLSQTSVSRAIEEVTTALNDRRVLTRFIHFPSTEEERTATIERNAALGMPGVLGFIDGTLVKIVTPPIPEKQAYRSRKGCNAINVQIVCDANLYIMNVNARFPGSCNDPHIYRASGVRSVMRNTFAEQQCWLLGDSAYPSEPWMMLPMHHALRPAPEYYYNKLHCHCRNVVERCIGVLKARWRCLLTDRTLHYDPVKAGLIVNACVVVHNFLVRHRAQHPRPIFENLGNDAPDEPMNEDMPLIRQAEQIREILIQHAYAMRQRIRNVPP